VGQQGASAGGNQDGHSGCETDANAGEMKFHATVLVVDEGV
jgi:hypothetical protein